MHSKSLTLRVLDGSETGFDDVVLQLIHQAGNPYFDFLFGGPDEAHRILRKWFARSSSEVARKNCTCLFQEGTLTGMYIGLDTEHLRLARRSDLFALMTEKSLDAEMLQARLAETHRLFEEVEGGSWYLSKVGIVEAARGKGWGRVLLDHFEQEGIRRGCTALCLDVAAENTPAVQLYSRAGFAIHARNASSSRTPMEYIRFVKKV